MPNDSPDRPSKSAREAPHLQRQDQRHEPQLAEQEPQLIDMSELASRITTAPSRPDDYAPPGAPHGEAWRAGAAHHHRAVAGRPRATGAPHGEAW